MNKNMSFLNILLILILGYLIVTLVVYLFQRKLLYHPYTSPHFSHDTSGEGLNHAFDGVQSLSYSVSNPKPQTVDYKFSIQPVIGVTANTIGRSPIKIKASYNISHYIKNSAGGNSTRDHTNSVTSSIEYKKSGRRQNF